MSDTPILAVAFSRKLRWFAIAGPTANIFAAIICRPLAHSAHGYTREVLMECASLSLLIAAINLLPLRIGRAETDGYIAFRGSRNRAWLESRMAAAMIAKSIRAGTSIEQCKTRWFSKTQPAGKPYLQQLPATLQHYARLVKMEHYEDAAIMLERALTIAARGGPHTKAIVFLLAACFQAEVRRSPDRANAWKTKIPSGKWLNPYQKTLLESSFAFCRGDRDTFITLRRQALLEFEEEPETPLRATTMARWEENTERMLKRLEASDAESAAASS